MPDEQLASPLIIEKLSRNHSLSDFDCSNTTLDTWLKRFAWTNQRAETAKTYVAHRGARIRSPRMTVNSAVGYFDFVTNFARLLHPCGQTYDDLSKYCEKSANVDAMVLTSWRSTPVLFSTQSSQNPWGFSAFKNS